MKKIGLRATRSLTGAIVSLIAVAAGPALGDSIRPAVGNKISKCAEIRNPGSYVLMRNLTAVGDGDCLVVATNRPVTIDLGGWTIFGDGRTGTGIIARGEDERYITVHNGSITGFERGVDLSTTRGAVIEKVRTSGVSVDILAGSDSIVRDNIVIANDVGIGAGSRSIVSGNIATANDTAIGAGSGSIVSGNIGVAKHGIGVGPFSIVSGNNAPDSDVTGIFTGVGSTVTRNNVHRDGGAEGISVSCPSNVIANTATGTGDNLLLIGDGCTNIDNLAP